MAAMTVEAIQNAISTLGEAERIRLAAWLNASTFDAWDQQMAEDFSPSGRGAHLVAQWTREAEEATETPRSVQ